MSRKPNPTGWFFNSLSGGLIFKLFLVLVLCPMVAVIVMRLWNLVALIVLGPSEHTDAAWREPLAGVLALIGIVGGLTAGVLVCRELWPKGKQP